MMRTSKIYAGLFFVGLMAAGSSCIAGTVTGQITTSLVLMKSCQVNGVGGTTGVNFGTLNFGTTSSLFTQATTQVLGPGGGAMSILCSAGDIPVIKFGGGTNDGQSFGGTRAMKSAEGNYVPYDLYVDSGTAQRLVINGTITLPASTGVAQTINLYGMAVGKVGLPSGVYSDTIAVELSF